MSETTHPFRMNSAQIAASGGWAELNRDVLATGDHAAMIPQISFKTSLAAAVLWSVATAAFAQQLPTPQASTLLVQVPQTSAGWGFLSCAAPGGRQEVGGGVGAVVGGLAGNRVGGKDHRVLGTAVGAVVGGLAGSWIGCRLQTGDQRRAQEAAQKALVEGRTQTWSNPSTGASGEVRLAENGMATQRLASTTFPSGVTVEPRYEQVNGEYEVLSTANLRSASTSTSRILGQLTRGEHVSVVAKSLGKPWYLIARNGQALGYVSSALLSPSTNTTMTVGTSCRVVEEVIRTPSDVTTTSYRACPTTSGGWSLATI